MNAQTELDKFLDRKATVFTEVMGDLLRSIARNDAKARQSTEEELADLIHKTMTLADLKGRERMLMQADRIRARFAHSGKFDAFEGSVPIVPGVTFEEAVEDIVTRDPRVVPVGVVSRRQWVSELYSREHAFAAARSATEKLTKRVQAAIQSLVQDGKSAGKTENEIMQMAAEESHNWSRSYSATVYRTNVSNAYTSGRFEQAKDESVKEVIPALEVVGLADAAERPNHAAFRGLVAPTEHAVWNRAKPPYGYQCFLPGTRVSGKFVSALKAAYSGPAVEIRTRNGCRLSVTVNHPILTAHGWRLAHSIHEGDDLLTDRGHVEAFNHRESGITPVGSAGWTVDNQDVPPLAEDVFEAFASKAELIRPVCSPVSPLDFHGDACWINGDVYVVGADGVLLHHAAQEAGGRQDRSEFGDSLTLGGTATSGEGRRDLDTMLHSRRIPSGGSPSRSALALDDEAVVAALLQQGPLRSLRLGPYANVDAVASQEFKDRAVVDAVLLSQLHRARPGFILADQVVSVRRFPFDGHVYDFQTEGGWILAQSVITSNCRHGVEFVSVFEMERRGLLGKGGVPQVYYPPNFANAHRDEGFRAGEF